jgi:hypothetical protein
MTVSTRADTAMRTPGVVVSHPMRPTSRVQCSRWRWLPLLAVVELLTGCATNPNVRVRRLPNSALQVDGPLAGPYPKLEDLAASACELMTSQPGASNGRHGFEYCALYYHSAKGGGYFLSYLSDIRSKMDSTDVKSCSLPTSLSDPDNGDAILLGGAHTHPHNRKFSPKDTSTAAHWIPTRFADQTTGRIWDRTLLVFFREASGECSAYGYNNSTRLVQALRHGEWIVIGKAYNDAGDVELLKGLGWTP